jgi:hypothetical protein
MPSAESERPSPVPDAAAEVSLDLPAAVARWVKTECGQAKYRELARRRGFWARLRRWWFVLIAALRDWGRPPAAAP